MNSSVPETAQEKLSRAVGFIMLLALAVVVMVLIDGALLGEWFTATCWDDAAILVAVTAVTATLLLFVSEKFHRQILRLGSWPWDLYMLLVYSTYERDGDGKILNPDME